MLCDEMRELNFRRDDYGKTRGQRFEDGDAEVLVQRRKYEQVSIGKQLSFLLGLDVSQKTHVIHSACTEISDVVRIASTRDEQPGFRHALLNERPCLQQKLEEAKAKSDMLIAQHRRSRALGKANDAGRAIGDGSKAAAFDRMKNKVQHTEARTQASSELLSDDVNGRFAALEKEDEVSRLLAELKAKRK